MVSGEIDQTQPQPQMDGPVEPKPITYIGGPLSGQKRPDFDETRKIVRIHEEEHVYYRTDLTVRNAIAVIDFPVMAYQGRRWDEVVPECVKRRAAKENEEGGVA